MEHFGKWTVQMLKSNWHQSLNWINFFENLDPTSNWVQVLTSIWHQISCQIDFNLKWDLISIWTQIENSCQI